MSCSSASAAIRPADALPDEEEDPGTTMRALVKSADGPGLTLDTARPIPGGGKPVANDVLIRVTHAGICGTDRHIWEWDDWARGRVPVGIVTGHEFVGVVEKIGPAVTTVETGWRVSAEGHITSGHDYNSRTGNAHIARDMQIIGVDRDGCFADYIMMPESNVWRVHDSIPDRVAAVMDPLGNAVHTVMEAQVSAKSVLITGVGMIGLMAVTVARAAGAARIFVVDVNPKRLELAKRLGADEAFDGRQSTEEMIREIQRATRGEGADVLLEMSGAEAAIDAGFSALRNGGTAAMLGLSARPITLNLNKHVIFKGAKVLGINGRQMFQTWYQMEDLLLAGRVELDEIITHEMALEEYERAFGLMESGEALKIVLKIGGV